MDPDVGTAELIAKGKKGPADLHAAFVECNHLGEFDLSVIVGNKPSTSLPFPVEVSDKFKVFWLHKTENIWMHTFGL